MQNQTHKLQNEILKPIELAINAIGYSNDMISRDVGFVGEGGEQYRSALVAYSSFLRKDTDTAVITVRGVENIDKIQYDSDISIFRSLSTPIIILPEYKNMDGREPRVGTFGLSKDASSFREQQKKTDHIVPLSRFREYLEDRREQFTPRRLERAKWIPEQLTLFDVAPNLNDLGFQITNKELIGRFEKSVNEILKSSEEKIKKDIIHASIKALGARILRDRKKKDWNINSAVDFLEEAHRCFPGYFKVAPEIAMRLDPLLRRFNANFDFSQISIETLSKFYASAFVTAKNRADWGIHYTPSRIAKTLLERMPIEELPPDKRILCDPTCGSGSLLAAGYERLAAASYGNIAPKMRHKQLVRSIFGNDKDEFAAEISRMTLMLFYPPHENNWKISSLDAEQDDFGDRWVKEINKRPTIIVANPPFGGIRPGKNEKVKRVRNQPDRSAFILKQCLDILPQEGLLGIVLTGTVLDQELEKKTRHSLLKECQLLEQWDVPTGWFEDVNRPAVVWIIKKSAPLSKIVSYIPLSDIPAPGEKTQLYESICVDIDRPPDALVPARSDLASVLSKIEKNSNGLEDYYIPHNGLQPKKKKITKEKTPNAHPWSGNASGTGPFSNFSDGERGWLELTDDHFPEKSQRKKLRENHLNQNEAMLMFRANGPNSSDYKWNSIALINTPEKNREAVAPSASFHAIFSKQTDESGALAYLRALWAILNHPIASAWFHERFRVQWISIKKLKKFPLPKNWDMENAKALACHVEKLIDKAGEAKKNSHDFKKSEAFETLKKLVKQMDDSVYKIYGIDQKERRAIEKFIGMEKRPLTKELGVSERKIKKKEPDHLSGAPSVSEYHWETTFEILDMDFGKQQIKMTIDGLPDSTDITKASDDGFWVGVTPSMPGWLFKSGAMGWVELGTRDANKIMESPGKYLTGFRLHKNAYMPQDEIDATFLFEPGKKGVKNARV